jgi:hypothetical protein
MKHQDTFASRLNRRLGGKRAALMRTVRRAALAATALFASACAGPVLHTGSYEPSGSADAREPMYERYAPARLLAQAAALELTAEQIAALSAIRDSGQAGRLTPLDAAQSARGVLLPTQRRAVEAAPRRPASPRPPPAPPHRH